MTTDQIADVAAEAPSGADARVELEIYFVLNPPKVGAEADDGPDEGSMNNPHTFIKIPMQVSAEEAGKLHDLLRTCVGVIVQTKQGDSEPKITPLACTA